MIAFNKIQTVVNGACTFTKAQEIANGTPKKQLHYCLHSIVFFFSSSFRLFTKSVMQFNLIMQTTSFGTTSKQ